MNLSDYAKIQISDAFKFTLSSEPWIVFNYKRKPKSGLFWNLFKSKGDIEKEKFLRNEFFIYSFMAVLQLTPNLYIEDKDEILDYLMNWLLSRGQEFFTAFGFKSATEFEDYYNQALSDYIDAPAINVESFAKVLGIRVAEQIDKKDSLVMMVYALKLLDFIILKLHLNKEYGEVEFINDLQN